MTDEAPELQVVPVEDLDKIEKLLDVTLSCIDMPHLSAIKQACMDELVQINNSIAEAQAAASATFQKESADYEAAQRKKAEDERKKAEAAAAAKEKSYA
jgi:ribosomal protein L12E/L44/L45/RPP1/RPP2